MAQTGTGKTAGFVLPLLQRLLMEAPQVASNSVRALVLLPTRELAEQLQQSLQTWWRQHQSADYQRTGFRVVAVEPDYFPQHYPEPLFEDGLQHRDRLRLALVL